MAITQEQLGGLWGDGGPYSQVHVIREIRILDDKVSRVFHYVKGNVNPTTYAVLKTMENEIKDEEIRAFLQEATFVSDEEGYEWHVYGQQAASPRGANRASEKLTDIIVRMHGLVMDRLGLELSTLREPIDDPPGAPGSLAADPELVP